MAAMFKSQDFLIATIPNDQRDLIRPRTAREGDNSLGSFSMADFGKRHARWNPGRGARIRKRNLVVGRLGLNPVHDLAEVPFLRLLAGRILLKGFEVLGSDGASRLQIAHLQRPPVIVLV